MWTHGRYFDIWRRPDHALNRSAPLVFLLAFAALASGCVVTDKIEFEESVNHPFAIISRHPVETYIIGYKESSATFSLTVWDPDIDDATDIPLMGKLVASSDRWSKPIFRSFCSPESPHMNEEGKTTYQVACEEDLPPSIENGALVEFTMVVSDLGFLSNKEPMDDANVAEVTWVVEMQEQL